MYSASNSSQHATIFDSTPHIITTLKKLNQSERTLIGHRTAKDELWGPTMVKANTTAFEDIITCLQ